MNTSATMIRSIEPDENEVPARKEHPGAAAVGWIEVIAGSMFSGKSEELIRRLRRARIARQRIQVFKPEIYRTESGSDRPLLFQDRLINKRRAGRYGSRFRNGAFWKMNELD